MKFSTLLIPPRTKVPLTAWRAARWSACVLFSCGVARAEDEKLSLLPDASGDLTVQLDNDLFFKADDNYTNGVRLSWVSGRKQQRELNPVQKLLQKLSGDKESIALFRGLTGFSDHEKLDYKYGFSLTQLMYTPTDRNALSAPPGERPYAGWLGFGSSLHVQDENALNSIELSLGTTGPHSLAHQAQDFIHDFRGFEKFKGWNSQLSNAVTGNLFFTQSRHLRYSSADGNWSLDGFWEWGFSLGTFRTDALAGSMFRFGWNLPVDFSDPRLSLRSYSHKMAAAGPRGDRGFSGVTFYGLSGWRVYAVGHDTTLDGSLFRTERASVTSEWRVGEVYLGGGIRYKRFEACYSTTYRTREFHEQSRGQKYGSVTVRLHL